MEKKTKVIFIMTDTQRFDMIGAHGKDMIKTPNLDRLVKQGLDMKSAYTCQPVCGPARSAMFSGYFPHSNGAIGNSMPLNANVKTVGQRLQEDGIHTAYIGKWHLDGGDYFGNGMCPHGWDADYWYDMCNYLDELSKSDRVRSRKTETMDGQAIDEDFTFGHRCSNRAIDFLQKHGDESFFMVVSYDEPHHPFLCPEPYASMYKDMPFPKSNNIWDDLDGKPQHQKIWAGNRVNIDKDMLVIDEQYFLGCNSYVDYEIGRVMDAANDCCEDAVIIYTSDHGDMMYSHSLLSKGPAMYEEICHIPLVIKHPNTNGGEYEHPVSHIDLVPTILDIFDMEIPTMLEGKSLLPAINNRAIKINNSVFMEFNRYEIDHDGFGGYQPIRAVYDGRYKLVVNLMTSDELYDLKNDPDEMVNLINDADYKEICIQLHNSVLDWMNETRDPYRGYYWEDRKWRTDFSKATWDYTGMTRQKDTEPPLHRELDYDTGLEVENLVRRKNNYDANK